ERNQIRRSSGRKPRPSLVSRTQASSCRWSSAREAPVSGSRRTSQRSLLSADRAETTANAPSRENTGRLQRTSRRPAASFSAASGGFSAASAGFGDGFSAPSAAFFPANSALAHTDLP